VIHGGQFLNPSAEELDLLLSVGGAHTSGVEQLPACSWTSGRCEKVTRGDRTATEEVRRVLIVAQEATSDRDARELFLRTSLQPVDYHWILDSISHYELQELTSYLVIPPNHDESLQTQHSMAF